MTAAQFLSSKTLARLRAIYEDLPERSKFSEITPQVDSLKEFLETSGNKIELQVGEVLFEQNDPGDGLYWIESGLLVVLHGQLDEPRLLTFRSHQDARSTKKVL